MELCFATGNENKLIEIEALLNPKGYQLKGLKGIGCLEDIPETADTLEGNALLKSQYVWQNYKTPCFADDTGLEVRALNNEPGVYSARYAGPQKNNLDNIDLLLKKLEGKQDRTARFRTVISLILSETEIYQFEGVVEGVITKELTGNQGFGYDPVFMPSGYDVTFAEMGLDVKNKISHRGIATKKLLDFLSK